MLEKLVGGRGPRCCPITSRCDLGRSHFFLGSATPSAPGERGSVQPQRPFLLQLFLKGPFNKQEVTLPLTSPGPCSFF